MRRAADVERPLPAELHEPDARAFSYWDTASGGWVVAPGCYQVMVGRSSRDIRLTGVVGLGGQFCAP